MDWVRQEGNFPEQRGPWTVLERKTWTGKYGLKVHHDRVIRPDGNEGIYEWTQIKEGVSILPIDIDKNVYLAQGFQYGLGDDSLEIAGGGINEGETPRQAATRELEEELGIKTYNLVDLGNLNQMTGLLYSPQYLFMAAQLDFGKSNQGATERITKVKMPLEEAVEKALSSEIHDAPAVATILRAYHYIKKHNL